MNTDKVLEKKRKKKEREEENKKENDIKNRALDLALDYFSCKKLKLVSNKVSFLMTYKIHKYSTLKARSRCKPTKNLHLPIMQMINFIANNKVNHT